MVTKEQLTERKRGKGGTLVRRKGDPTVYVVKDLMQRKSYDRPGRIGIGPLDRDLARGVMLDQIEIAPVAPHTYIPDYCGKGKPCCDLPRELHEVEMRTVGGKRQKVAI